MFVEVEVVRLVVPALDLDINVVSLPNELSVSFISVVSTEEFKIISALIYKYAVKSLPDILGSSSFKDVVVDAV